MSQRIFRYEVPVDDRRHIIALFSDPVAVDCRNLHVVEFWAIAHDTGLSLDRSFRIVGTGQPLPDNMWRHWGTAIAPGGQLVWHLIEVKP
jgi:hypothetical protein